ncbi:WYL domain-containing protein [Vibrio sp. SS-MA-C1-2]|uniref:WYL domain-containing protein n=1 Tax=Vibrio sp. SS-MA-C1-2 TaxID=2908646 RepID=UPI001F3F74DA|nr:WYL domain-containing protein [Vibrio sp. SS-MA-C1-2]UJF17093.1 WYL domain-containing protein [Vibrio sp. SS-MA-C1-2]
MAPQNLYYDNSVKCYFASDEFKPLFCHDNQKAMSELVTQLSGTDTIIGQIDLPFEAPSKLIIPDIHHVATVCRAIKNDKALTMTYVSLSSGEKEKKVIPHSIIDNGLRWHMRAYDCEHQAFRDFVLSIIKSVAINDDEVKDNQRKLADKQWMLLHPKNVKHLEAIALDYRMENNVCHLEVRAALAGYLLRRWNVDCTAAASSTGQQYQLWLKNKPTLYGVENV